MRFQKGNKIGHRFTSEDQPSQENIQAGRSAAAKMREIAAALLGGYESDDNVAQKVRDILPKLKRSKVTKAHAIVMRQIVKAGSGDTKAYANVMNTIGAFKEEHVITSGENGSGFSVNIEVSSDTDKDVVNKLLKGEE